MKRGDIVVFASAGPYTRKPRPALVVQSNLFNLTHGGVSLCLITTEFVDAPMFLVAVAPGSTTGLKLPSQIMIDKVASVPVKHIAKVIGHISPQSQEMVDAALRPWFAV